MSSKLNFWTCAPTSRHQCQCQCPPPPQFCLFFVFRKGGQWHMGDPFRGARPCMAVHHKKLHIGTLLHLPNGSLCTDCVPQGLLTWWVAYINIYLLSFNIYICKGRQDSGPTYMNHYENHMYLYWYNVSNLRNDNVTEVRLIVSMPFKWHNVEGNANIDAK